MNKDVRIVVLGGGTGTSHLLEELKHHTNHLTAIVAMTDDGGSNAKIRDQLGILPFSDARQCVRSLVHSSTAKELFDYRFSAGDLQGYTAGNIILAALYEKKGGFKAAINSVKELFDIQSNILPVTTDDVRLKMLWDDGKTSIFSEHNIDTAKFDKDPRTAILQLEPEAQLDVDAHNAIREADLILIAPGNLYCSTGALLATSGIGSALNHATAKKMYICNLIAKQGHTDGFTVTDYADELERIAQTPFLDVVLCNIPIGQQDISIDSAAVNAAQYVVVQAAIRSDDSALVADGTDVQRSTARHNVKKVVEEIDLLYNYHVN